MVEYTALVLVLLPHRAPTDLLGHGVLVEGEEAVDKDGHTDHRGGQQPARVEAQPGEVDGDLLPEVISDVIQRLVFVPDSPPSPEPEQDLPGVEFLAGQVVSRPLEVSL